MNYVTADSFQLVMLSTIYSTKSGCLSEAISGDSQSVGQLVSQRVITESTMAIIARIDAVPELS